MAAPTSSSVPNAGRRAVARVLARLTLVVVVVAGLVATASPAGAGSTHAVAPWGSDSAPGTASSPWRTLGHAMSQLEPGDTLVVRGGTYAERIQLRPTPGRADAPVRVVAAAGEQPLVRGLLWIKRADHWTLDGIDVTWDPATGQPNEHMVKLTGGRGWRLTNAEIWGAKSYAGVLVSQSAVDFRIDNNVIHDTAATNDLNQDHLIYVNNGWSGSGIIERNRLYGSPNGRGVKLGPPSLEHQGTSNITIRYNTFVDNRGPSNIQISGSSSDNHIHHNVFVGVRDRYENVTGYHLDGRGNRIHDNVGWGSRAVIEGDEPGLVDLGGNLHADPRLDAAHAPRLAAARTRGHLADGSGVTAWAGNQTADAALVNALYADFLGRSPSPAELAERVARLRDGTPSRVLIDEFASSDEWAGSIADGFYRTTLGRPADSSGRAYWLSQLRAGVSPVSIGAGFYASDEYVRRSGGTDRSWISALYEDILGRPADASGLGHWIHVRKTGVSRLDIASAFYGSVESRTDRVTDLYRQLLGRKPDAGGRAYWVGVLADGQDIRLAATLASSAEYARRAIDRAG